MNMLDTLAHAPLLFSFTAFSPKLHLVEKERKHSNRVFN